MGILEHKTTRTDQVESVESRSATVADIVYGFLSHRHMCCNFFVAPLYD